MRVGELVQSVAKHKALLYVFITSLAARVVKKPSLAAAVLTARDSTKAQNNILANKYFTDSTSIQASSDVVCI
jgi:hypothetical protein